MWRNSLDTGKLPEGIAIAWITPIYKGGNKSLPANYRPVALTNHVTKIFERVLKKEIVLHLERNDLLNASQHGFTSGRSTISQILNYYGDILEKIENGSVVDAVYFDFAKAFDKVDHDILLMKMKRLNITGRVKSWCESFPETKAATCSC